MESQMQGCCVELANRASTSVRLLRDQAPAYSVRIIDAEAPNSSSNQNSMRCVPKRDRGRSKHLPIQKIRRGSGVCYVLRDAEFQLGQNGREASGLNNRRACGAAGKLNIFRSAFSGYG